MLDTLRSVLRFEKLTLDSTERALERAANIDDLRAMAKKRLPGGVFDYIDGGAEDERALRNNCARFGDYELRPRILRDMSAVDTTTTVLGKPVPRPLVLSPTGFSRIADPQGELAVARVAAELGLPYTLSSLATRSIEEVAAVSDGSKWFQVYVWKDRGIVKEMVGRAQAAGYEAIVITVDFATLGRRERDVRRGFTLPPKIGLDTILDGVRHPKWTLDFVRSEPILFANVTSTAAQDGTDAVALGDYVHDQLDPTLSWADIEWFRSIWDGPIVLKGIQDVEDSVIAAGIGMDAIALSNHGGRQLDDSPAPVDLIAETVQRVAGQAEIYCDGGVRRGSDIIKAVALGATACMIGRGYLYGLGAAGESGVRKALGFFEAEMERSMALIGASSISDLGEETVRRVTYSAG